MKFNIFKVSSPVKSAETAGRALDITIYLFTLAIVIFNSCIIIWGLADKKDLPKPIDPTKATAATIVNAMQINESYLLRYTSNIYTISVTLTVMMGLLVIILLRTGIKSDKLNNKINEAESKYKDIYFVDSVSDIYKEISDEILKRPSTKKLSIHVLAFTLHQITHLFEKWQEQDKLKNIILHLYCLTPEYIHNSRHIHDSWEKKLAHNMETIESYIRDNKEILEQNNVSVEIYHYDYLPVVNGIRINDKYYISLASWDNKKEIRDSDNAKYIRILPDDRTNLGEYLRTVFSSWLDRARISNISNNSLL